MAKKYSVKDIEGGDCFIMKASKQKMYLINKDAKKIYLIVSHDVIEFPREKFSRYFNIYKKYKDKK